MIGAAHDQICAIVNTRLFSGRPNLYNVGPPAEVLARRRESNKLMDP